MPARRVKEHDLWADPSKVVTSEVVHLEPLIEPGGSGHLTRQTLIPVCCTLTLLATIATLGFLSGGYIFQRVAPVALVIGGLALAAVWLIGASDTVRPAWSQLVSLIAFAAYVLWAGLSILWSAGPDLSWIAFDVAALYLLVAVAVAILPGGRLQLRLAAYGFAVVVVAVATYALLGKIVPDVVTHAHLFARLSAPVGYWNVLAAMIVMAVPVLLATTSGRRSHPWVRGLAASGLVVLFFTFFFTFSRGGYVALAAALLVYFVYATERLSGVVSLMVPGALTAAILYHVRDLDTLFTQTTDDALRSTQAHALAWWFVAAVALAFVAQILVALAQRRWTLSPRQMRMAGVVVLVVLAITPIAFGAYYFPRHGGLGAWVTDNYRTALSGSGPSNNVNRLTSLGTSGRIPWYHEALRGFGDHKITGSGAGTFAFTNYRYRDRPWVVKHSHSQWLNVLSESGVVGLALFAIAICGLVLAAFGRPREGRDDAQRSLLAACQAAVIAFVAHMSLDWDWDMPVITISFLLLAGASAAYVRDRRGGARRMLTPDPARPAGRWLLATRLLATGLIALGIVSWTLPYFAERAGDRAVDQLSRHKVTSAIASARQASDLNPLAVDPLLVLATAQAQQGHRTAAEATIEKAIRLQPDNFVPYYRMGLLQRYSFDRKADAAFWFRRALALNPLDALTRRELNGL